MVVTCCASSMSASMQVRPDDGSCEVGELRRSHFSRPGALLAPREGSKFPVSLMKKYMKIFWSR